MSQQWEKAYIKVAEILEDEKKKKSFLIESKKWLENYYRSNPNYKEEIKNKPKTQKLGIPKIEKVSEINQKATKILINELKTLSTQEPIISVVVPIFNHYEYLFKCLSSVAKQGDIPLELVCVDDNSSDKRVRKLLEELAPINPNIKIIFHNENKGISYTQNEAVENAKGEYIAFLDCDDFLKENALSVVYQKIRANRSLDYIFTDRTNIDEKDNVLYDACYKTVKEADNIQDDLLDRMIASHLKVIKRETYLKVGGSDAKMSGIQDWDLALKIAEVGEIEYIPQTLYCHRLHENSVTSSDSVAQYKKSNILRREYAAKWLLSNNSPQKDISDIKRIIKNDGIESLKNLDNVALFDTKNLKLNTWYCPKELKEAFSKNKICIMDARGNLDKSYIDFLKDFNSYFDLILCDRLSVSSQIIGTLWSEHIIWTSLEISKKQ
jgi:glycosyltransferase involved in cell wall biosynthesis